MAKTMQEVLVEHLRTGITGCRCGWADLGRSHTGHLAQELEAAGYGLVTDAKREALLHAAEALDMQPPKLKAQYVSTLRLYAFEPWRLETCPSVRAATHPGREHGASQ